MANILQKLFDFFKPGQEQAPVTSAPVSPVRDLSAPVIYQQSSVQKAEPLWQQNLAPLTPRAAPAQPVTAPTSNTFYSTFAGQAPQQAGVSALQSYYGAAPSQQAGTAALQTHYGVTVPEQDTAIVKQREAASVFDNKLSSFQDGAGLGGPAGAKNALTDELYRGMDDDTRAAVDFNGLLDKALQADKALLADNDANKSGMIALGGKNSEIAPDNEAGYRKAYQLAFGGDDDGEIIYAPNTVALLNLLDLKNSRVGLDDYMLDRGFITQRDIDKGKYKNSVGDNAGDARSEMLQQTTSAMKLLNETLAKGRIALYGSSVTVDPTKMTADQKTNFVASLQQGLMNPSAPRNLNMLGEDPRFSSTNSINLTGMIDPAKRKRFETMANGYKRIEQVTTPEQRLDTDLMGAVLAEQGLDVNEWLEYVNNIQSGESAMNMDLLSQEYGG